MDCSALILHGYALSQAKGLRISKAPCDIEDRLAGTANERRRPEQSKLLSSAARGTCACPSLIMDDLGRQRIGSYAHSVFGALAVACSGETESPRALTKIPECGFVCRDSGTPTGTT